MYDFFCIFSRCLLFYLMLSIVIWNKMLEWNNMVMKLLAFITFLICVTATIKIITLMTIHCSRQWWPPQDSIPAAASFLLFFTLSGLTLFHFISAIFEGPGYLPLKWMPVIYSIYLLLNLDYSRWILSTISSFQLAENPNLTLLSFFFFIILYLPFGWW